MRERRRATESDGEREREREQERERKRELGSRLDWVTGLVDGADRLIWDEPRKRTGATVM